jgi:hypothetical protein
MTTAIKPATSGRKTNAYYLANNLPIPGTREYNQSKATGSGWEAVDLKALESIEPFELEDAPINEGRGSRAETILIRQKIDKTIVGYGIPVGKSFTLPKAKKQMVLNYLKQAYGEMRFKTSRVGDGSHVRFVRVA